MCSALRPNFVNRSGDGVTGRGHLRCRAGVRSQCGWRGL